MHTTQLAPPQHAHAQDTGLQWIECQIPGSLPSFNIAVLQRQAALTFSAITQASVSSSDIVVAEDIYSDRVTLLRAHIPEGSLANVSSVINNGSFVIEYTDTIHVYAVPSYFCAIPTSAASCLPDERQHTTEPVHVDVMVIVLIMAFVTILVTIAYQLRKRSMFRSRSYKMSFKALKQLDVDQEQFEDDEEYIPLPYAFVKK